MAGKSVMQSKFMNKYVFTNGNNGGPGDVFSHRKHSFEVVPVKMTESRFVVRSVWVIKYWKTKKKYDACVFGNYEVTNKVTCDLT